MFDKFNFVVQQFISIHMYVYIYKKTNLCQNMLSFASLTKTISHILVKRVLTANIDELKTL